MSDRERWIVYPLLFLAIGLAMRSAVQIDEEHETKKSLETTVVKCKGLEVLGADEKPRLILGTTADGEGSLELVSDHGVLAAQLSTNPSGALLSLFNSSGEIALRIGHESQQVVLLITDKSNSRVQPLIAIPVLPARPQEPMPQKSAPKHLSRRNHRKRRRRRRAGQRKTRRRNLPMPDLTRANLIGTA